MALHCFVVWVHGSEDPRESFSCKVHGVVGDRSGIVQEMGVATSTPRLPMKVVCIYIHI